MATDPSPASGGSSRAARRRERQVSFLFEPESVARVLAGLRYLSKLIGDPYDEGEPAVSLPRVRKSARELFRVLGNTHYEHLADLLAALDACAAAGFTQPELLRTRGRRPFVESIAEVAVADHLRRHGFGISGFDESKANDPVPDILATQAGATLAVEVYCPRVWPSLDAYTQGLTDRVKNLDRALDFVFRIEHAQLEQFDPDHRLLHLHPGVLDDGLDEQTRLGAIAALVDQLEAALDVGTAPRAELELAALNLGTTVELEAAPATDFVPARGGVVSGPSLSAYRPESMFDRNVAGAISKLKKGQALGVVDAVPVLVVEMSQSELASELVDTSYYRPHFLETIEEKLADLRGYGAVVFTEFTSWQEQLRMHITVVEDTIVDPAAVGRAFPG